MYHSLYSTANVIGEGNAEPPAVCYHSNRYPDVIPVLEGLAQSQTLHWQRTRKALTSCSPTSNTNNHRKYLTRAPKTLWTLRMELTMDDVRVCWYRSMKVRWARWLERGLRYSFKLSGDSSRSGAMGLGKMPPSGSVVDSGVPEEQSKSAVLVGYAG